MSNQNSKFLQLRNVADIDLWVGGLSESLPLNGGVLDRLFHAFCATVFRLETRG